MNETIRGWGGSRMFRRVSQWKPNQSEGLRAGTRATVPSGRDARRYGSAGARNAGNRATRGETSGAFLFGGFLSREQRKSPRSSGTRAERSRIVLTTTGTSLLMQTKIFDIFLTALQKPIVSPMPRDEVPAAVLRRCAPEESSTGTAAGAALAGGARSHGAVGQDRGWSSGSPVGACLASESRRSARAPASPGRRVSKPIAVATAAEVGRRSGFSREGVRRAGHRSAGSRLDLGLNSLLHSRLKALLRFGSHAGVVCCASEEAAR